MKSLHFEQWWPYASAITVLACWALILGFPFPNNPDPLMGASGTIASVLVGFLATAKAVILGITGSEVFKKLKAAGYSNLLFSYLSQAVFGGIVLLVVSTFGFFFPRQPPPLWFQYLWVMAAATAILLY